MGKLKDIEIIAESIAEGPTAQKGAQVVYSARFYLRRGKDVTPDYQSIARYGDRVSTREVNGQKLIEHRTLLGKRRSIAGIEKALVGMSGGSYREVIIPPHLGYGGKGLAGLIPPNAILRVELWLHQVI